jgi:Protein of unknown function (DUF433).
MQTVTTTHIYLDENGVAWITGANTKVIEVVLDKTAWGWSPEEMHEQHPHLSLGQIHAALSYYYDHQAELDAEMKRRYEEVEEMRKRAGESPIVRKLKELGKL